MPQDTQDSSEDYTALVAAYSKVFTAPKEQANQHIKEALLLSVAFDQETVEAAKREDAAVAMMESAARRTGNDGH